LKTAEVPPVSTVATWSSLFRGRPYADIRGGLALRYRWPVWVCVFSLFAVVHFTLFGIVHNYVDTRVCIGYSDDPLLRLIPFDLRWEIVTRQLYVVMVLTFAAVVLIQAGRGVHTPALRWALALCFMSSMRMATLMLIPICRPTVVAFGPPPLASPQMLNLYFVSVPWRIFALNDVVYSGHTALFLLLLMATCTFPRIVRIVIAVFTAFMIYGLLATRDHYSVDVLLAFPCAYFADFLACSILRATARHASARATRAAAE
jgi:hypothetical protein